MESMILLPLVAALFISPATPVTVECVSGNCSESEIIPIFRFNIFRFPFFAPASLDDERDRVPLDDAINPMEAPSNESDASGFGFAVRITQVVSFQEPDQQDVDQPNGDFDLQKFFDNMLANSGLLDLSGQTLTSHEVYSALAARKEEGRPVTTLVLSNSRIHPMDAGAFAAAESTIVSLDMTNSSVNLDSLRGLTNLRELKLSNNNLTTFPWLVLMADTLEVLDLSHNQYEEVRPELSMLKSLKALNMSHNRIMFVEEAPLNLLPNLETVDLSMNLLKRVNVAGLENLNRLNLDWNYLRLMGRDCLLPPQPLLLKLASNPWRCDCGLLEARDSNQVLDLDLLQCSMNSNSNVYNDCIDCERSFLLDGDNLRVASLTKDNVHHQGCNDIPGIYNYLSKEYTTMRDTEPVTLIQDIVLFIAICVSSILCVYILIKLCFFPQSVSGGKVWIKAQEIPKWSLDKLGKQQEVPYVKIDKTPIKS